ncbi:uncharacterized protein LOC136085501 [Hydra vulgaris]|uniref:Kinesin-like protein n=1 Tax=Hydra vulgaris TaxID=6087 RepID=A0ABM4CM73_HYDVU
MNERPEGPEFSNILTSKVALFADDTTIYSCRDKKPTPSDRLEGAFELVKDLTSATAWGSQWLEITDLLASKKENIKILTNSENDVVVENLTTHTVISYESTMDLVQKGIINRKIGITNMNERSSRSHLIFRLVIESREISELNNSMEANGTIIAAELNVVDLAGSERAGQTGAQGIRLKESSFINTSLMSLGVVIRKLSEGDKSCHIPYRDSKLTRLLQKSLGGNARTCIICTVSPVVLEETQQTLLFASQAKEVKNRPTVNEVLDDKSMMRKQMNEINLLKKKIIKVQICFKPSWILIFLSSNRMHCRKVTNRSLCIEAKNIGMPSI